MQVLEEKKKLAFMLNVCACRMLLMSGNCSYFRHLNLASLSAETSDTGTVLSKCISLSASEREAGLDFGQSFISVCSRNSALSVEIPL